MSKYGVFSGPYFPAFGLNRERYGVYLRIQSEYGKIQTRKNSVLSPFSRSALFRLHFPKSFKNTTISIPFFQYRFTVGGKFDNYQRDYEVWCKVFGIVFINNRFFGQYVIQFLFWWLNDSTLLKPNISL